MSHSLNDIVRVKWGETGLSALDASRYMFGMPLRKEGKTATEIAMRAQPSIYDYLNRQMQETGFRWEQLLTSPPVIIAKRDNVICFGIDFATKETPVTKKTKPEKFNTIGVRFLESPNPLKIYTYKVRIGAKVHLGQELVADTERGPAVVVAVRIDKTPQPSSDGISRLRYVEKKAVAL